MVVSSFSVDAATAVEEGDTGGEEADEQPHRYDRLGLERPSPRDRAAFVGFHSVNGALLAGQGCYVVDCPTPVTWGVAPLAGGAVGFAGGWYLSRGEGVNLGRTSAQFTGVTYGHAMGSLAMTAAGVASQKERMTGAMIGQITGLMVAYPLAERLLPTSGDMALIRYSAMWGGLLGASAGMAFGLYRSVSHLALGAMASATAGKIAGGFYTASFPMPYQRVGAISIGGYIGAAAGWIPAAMTGRGFSDHPVVWGPVTAGAIAGLVTGALVTRNWNGHWGYPESNWLAVRPSSDGRGLVVGIGGRLRPGF